MSRTYEKKEAAAHYDASRAMPEDSMALWMGKLTEIIPAGRIKKILDLGGGTGRFAGALQRTYDCPVTVVDPSEEMLKQGSARGLPGIKWVCAGAEKLPFPDDSFDFVWMSQVYHHLEDKAGAFHEISRVLKPRGYLAVRNGTIESDRVLKWMELFPEAMEVEAERIPHYDEIIRTIRGLGFSPVKDLSIMQRFAADYKEYYEKIAGRGLSVLISITDEAFNRGLVKFKEWTEKQVQDKPVYEPVDLFVFRNKK